MSSSVNSGALAADAEPETQTRGRSDVGMVTASTDREARRRKRSELPRILMVDDEASVLEGLAALLGRRFQVTTAVGGRAGLEVLSEDPGFAVIVSDMNMPGMTGAQFLGEARTVAADAVRLLLTGSNDLEDAVAAVNEGQIFRFLTKPCPSDILIAAVDAAVHQHDLQVSAHRRLQESLTSSIRALARAIDAKDPSTRMHSERVAHLATRIAEAMGWPPDRVDLIRDAGLVHDVGKIGVPDAVLLKPGRLTDDEFEAVKLHAALGAEIVSEILTPEQVSWVRHHHEKFDGSGYPDRIAGEDIPEAARILCVADSVDVMTSRPYCEPRTWEDAMDECRRVAGSHFDPRVVEAITSL